MLHFSGLTSPPLMLVGLFPLVPFWLLGAGSGVLAAGAAAHVNQTSLRQQQHQQQGDRGGACRLLLSSPVLCVLSGGVCVLGEWLGWEWRTDGCCGGSIERRQKNAAAGRPRPLLRRFD